MEAESEKLRQEAQQNITDEIIKHRSALFAFVFSLTRDLHIAEDVFQDTCRVVCQKAEQFEPGSNFLAWSRAIAFREVKRLSRSKKYSNRAIPTDKIEDFAAIWNDEDEDDYAERRSALAECLKMLSKRALKVLVWFYEKQHSCKDIATKHNTTVPAIHMLMKRTREKLKDCIGKKLVADLS